MPRQSKQAYNEEIRQDHVYINSNFRLPGSKSESDFKADSLQEFSNAKFFSVDQICYENLLYNITKENNIVLWSMPDSLPEGGWVGFKIPEGYYDIKNLKRALVDGFNNHSYKSWENGKWEMDSKIRVYSMDGTDVHPIDSSVPRKTNKFIFTNEGDLTTNFVIINSPRVTTYNTQYCTRDNCGPARILGFKKDVDETSVDVEGQSIKALEAPLGYNLDPISNIYICSRTLTKYTLSRSYTIGNPNIPNLLAKLPLHHSQFGSITVYDFTGLNFDWIPDHNSLIDIQVLDENGRVVDNHGGNIEIKLTFFTKHSLIK